MLKETLDNVRKNRPLVHCLTNYVTVNDCANALLACGASPIMADDIAEAEEISSLCSAVCVNIGTLNARTIPAMALAAKTARALGKPAVLDPVGAGASSLRTQTARDFLSTGDYTAVRGNLSETRTLASLSGRTRGVDALDEISDARLDEAAEFAKAFARRENCVVAITGRIDIVSDGTKAYAIRNGHPMMRLVTGTGCMLSAILAGFLAANPENALNAAAAAVAAMGLCGELAQARLSPSGGNASLRTGILDALYNLTGDELERGAKLEIL